MKEGIAEKIKRLMYEGWMSKPAYIRAFGWVLAGFILGVIIR